MAHPIGRLLLAATACGACLCASVQAQTLDTVVIRAELENMEGLARSASEGIVSGERLRALPLLRPGVFQVSGHDVVLNGHRQRVSSKGELDPQVSKHIAPGGQVSLG